MSAFVCGDFHHRILVEAGLHLPTLRRGSPLSWWVLTPHLFERPGISWDQAAAFRRELRAGDYEEATRVLRMLFAENVKSVRHRYPGSGALPGPNDLDEDPDHLEHKSIRGFHLGNPVAILAAIRCYEYQTCEHRGWHDSEARAYCNALARAMASLLIDREAEGVWEVADVAQLLRQVKVSA